MMKKNIEAIEHINNFLIKDAKESELKALEDYTNESLAKDIYNA